MSDRTLRTTDDAVRALIRIAHFGGDAESAAVCQDWADDYDADNEVPAEPVKPATPAKK